MKKVILITGGSSGMGKAAAARLCKKHTVVILSSKEPELRRAAKQLHCDYVVCDVSSPAQVEHAVATVLKKHKRIDVLINSAGVWLEGRLENNDYTDITRTININTLGTIFMTRAVLPSMQKRKRGLIINIVSVGGLVAKEERSVYDASKWAITGFTRSLALETRKDCVAVTAVYPGKTNTKMFEKAGIKKNLNEALKPDDSARLIKFVVDTPSSVILSDLSIIPAKD